MDAYMELNLEYMYWKFEDLHTSYQRCCKYWGHKYKYEYKYKYLKLIVEYNPSAQLRLTVVKPRKFKLEHETSLVAC